MRRTFVLFLLAAALSIPAAAEVLRNGDVVRMIRGGLAASTVEDKIKVSDTDFMIDTDSLIALKADKVPDSVIKAMIARQSKVEAKPQPQPQPQPAHSDMDVTATPAPPPAASRPEVTYSREFDVYLETSNWNTCPGTLTIDEKGLRGTGCAKRNLNFEAKWSEVRSFCYESAFFQTMYIQTEKKTYRVSSNDGKGVGLIQEFLRKVQPDIRERKTCGDEDGQ